MNRFGLTQAELSEKVGASRSHIANILRLLALPKKVQESLLQGVLLMGQARPLLSLDTPELMQKAADHIAEHNLSAREAEQLVAKLKKDRAQGNEKCCCELLSFALLCFQDSGSSVCHPAQLPHTLCLRT